MRSVREVGGVPEVGIRAAEGPDFAAAERIETEADAALIEWLQATTWWPAASAEQRAASAGFMLVAELCAGSGLVGFAHVLEVDGAAHLEQVSVLPAFGRQGIGRRLVDAAADLARERGHRELTLRTFAEVPWNAPFYSTCGFEVTEPASAFQHSLVRAEESLGSPALGARVQMTRVL